jgi:peptidoglycan/LPS O-acetylase OafA/YrhL
LSTPEHHGSTPRLGFLDALRGLAALSVAVAHRAEATFSEFVNVDREFFRFGQFGVVVFFLCSGFIIPASLERYNSVRRFLIGRFFRLFPLYWFALAATLVMASLEMYELPGEFADNPGPLATANATMLQALAGIPLALGPSWTLGFEWGFYILMSVLCILGVHRHSRALAFTAAALAVGIGALNSGSTVLAVSLLVLIGAAVGIAGWRTADQHVRLYAGGLLGILIVVLTANRYAEAWFNVALFAVMFSGTVLYRHFKGALSGRATTLTYIGSAIMICFTVFREAGYRSWGITFTAAFLTFGVFYLLRGRQFPWPIVYLGTISYSLYLLHPLVYAMVPQTYPMPMVGLLGAIAIAIAISVVAYRGVELPMITLGRRVVGRRISR